MNTDVFTTLNVMTDSNARGYDILIVDDNVEQAHLTQLLVEEYGYSAHFVTNSRQALDTIQLDRPPVVILDLMMPGIDGLRLCKRIKNAPDMEDTKVIIYSGKIYDSDRRKAFELGADAFFSKPTRANMLITKIKELLHPVSHGSYQN